MLGTKRPHTFLAVLLFALGSCKSPEAPNDPLEFAVTFAGSHTGALYMTTAVGLAGIANYGSITGTAAVSVPGNRLLVFGVQALANDRYDDLSIVFPATVGSHTLQAGCDPEAGTCSGGAAYLDSGDDNYGKMCELTTGTVTVTSVRADWVVGTFSGSGTCYDFNHSVLGAFTVSGGKFSVPNIGTL